MLTRAEFLLLTDLTRPRFDARARRNQLPFSPLPEYEQRLGRRAYPERNALLTVLSEDLTRENGIDLDLANAIVKSCKGDLQITDLSEGRELIWIGAALTDLGGGDRGRMHLVGTIKDVADQLSPTRLGVPDIFRVVLANASRAAATVRSRALEHGIELGPFF